ncbi:RagB/SusD family nutrient uptake outer membrane protein [Danxiaibacter flavus]|uniref:RagB/SusD family nutrient uptake outer membrane protein n=1 Tax=Danxiaibacter flavus TaxID=3049108 RepID=A0ABV3ZHI5_9BACT|nr:RagB/SusD family nutrient uptake outer membrane protein [Chitinophagaceae bacterium DXS]
MKRIIYTVLVVSLACISCKKYLSQVPEEKISLESTFQSWETANKFLSNIYSRVPDEYGQRDAGGNQNAGVWTCASDEAELSWADRVANNLNNGSWDASTGLVSDYWTNYYQAIRAAGIFLENADKINGISPEQISMHKAEARALRAIFYFYLMRIYGPVILLGEKPVPVDANLQIPRNTYDECTAYVVEELEKAAQDLPITYASTEQDGGRITKGVCYAIRAQALMYAASPLFNGNADYAALQNKDGKQLISQTNDGSKWKIAADAYLAFINQFVPSVYDLNVELRNGVIDPYMSCKNAIIKDWNKEAIFIRVDCSIAPWQYALTPFHSGAPGDRDSKGGTAIDATQNMVDAFFTANGRSIDDPLSGYQSTGYSNFQAPMDTRSRSTYNSWANREPRFYVNITYNGSLWLNTQNGEIITELFYNGNSGRSKTSNDYSKTGYVVRKAMGFGKWDNNNRTLILMRLAEVYLSYAECLNESDPGNADILKYLNLIRVRAGVPEYGSASLPAPENQAEMRLAIRKERRVELAFENHRYFDVRRWKTAEQTQGGPMYGLTIGSDLPDFLKVTVFETRVFNKQHYLFPIPSGDINNDKQLVQNTGW